MHMYLQSRTGKELLKYRWSLLSPCNQIMFLVYTQCASASRRWFLDELKVKSVGSESFHPGSNASVVQICSSRTQLLLEAPWITFVESLYTPEIVGPTEKLSTFRLPRLPSLLVSRSNDSTSLSPTGSSKVSDISAITLPSL